MGGGEEPHAIDAMYMLYVLMRDVPGLTLKVVAGMGYYHTVHAGSYYLSVEAESDKFRKSFNWTL